MLTPDFLRKDGALEIVVEAQPDVFNHNLETVPSLYLTVRPGARYFHSLRLLQRVKELDPTMFTKSGIMVGLGEERNEMLQVMDDLRSANVDFLTVGQYLAPSRKHHPVMRFVPPDEFSALETIGNCQGLPVGGDLPLTRSSHHAGEDFAQLLAPRAQSTRNDHERHSAVLYPAFTVERFKIDAAFFHQVAAFATPRPRCSHWSPTSSDIPRSCRCAGI